MQFKGLIDRCEAFANGSEIPSKDGSDEQRLITASDLEGFWSMVSIQVDNVDKRFEKLQKWRDNNWDDPETVKKSVVLKKTAIKKKNLKKDVGDNKLEVKETAVARKKNSCSEFIKMMRQKKLEKAQHTALDNIIMLNKSPCQKNSTMNTSSIVRKSLTLNERLNSSQQKAVLVRDRKMFSPSPTVLILKQPVKRKTMDKCEDRSETLAKPLEEMNGLTSQFETGLVKTPQISSHRKSILRTPASIKSTLKNVAFQEKLRVHRFNFFDNDDSSDAEDK